MDPLEELLMSPENGVLRMHLAGLGLATGAVAVTAAICRVPVIP